MRGIFENNIYTMDLGCWGVDVLTGEEHRSGEDRLTVAKIVLPELTGTEKQIKWANDIRCSKLLDLFHDIKEVGLENLFRVGKVDSLQKVVDLMLKNNPRYNWILATTRASEVIDKR